MARMMRVMATKAVRYGGKRREAGEVFETRERDGRALIAIRKATAAQGEMIGLAPGPSAAGPLFGQDDAGASTPGGGEDLQQLGNKAGEDLQGKADKPAAGKGRRRYGRRDLQAEE